MTTYACQNCAWEGTAPNPAKDVLQRHEVGDPFSDLECPECGALVFEAEHAQ
jgi:predicted RNA-binding Zn-ribbon protein involved in translation (DUF1610 family)